jgi:hypothetical protein
VVEKAKRNFEKKLADGNGGNKRPFFSYIKRRQKPEQALVP